MNRRCLAPDWQDDPSTRAGRGPQGAFEHREGGHTPSSSAVTTTRENLDDVLGDVVTWSDSLAPLRAVAAASTP
jgi:hypothetical protein